jgi:hypothetical protein
MRAVVVAGYPRQTAYLEKLLNDHAPGVSARAYPQTRLGTLRAAARMLRAHASISIGGPHPNRALARVCNALNRPAIVLWVGSDVQQIASESRDAFSSGGFVHWACAPHLVSELAAVGISAKYVPIAAAKVPDSIAPMPSTFTVLAYLPEPRRSFYGQEDLWCAASALPDAQFFVVGPGIRDLQAPPNVEYLGEVGNIEAYIDAASVLLRFPEHDGLSVMVVEALARARHVIWTYPFRAAIHAASRSDATTALMRLFERHLQRALTINEEGARYIAAEFAPEKIARGVELAILDALEARHQQSNCMQIDTGHARN